MCFVCRNGLGAWHEESVAPFFTDVDEAFITGNKSINYLWQINETAHLEPKKGVRDNENLYTIPSNILDDLYHPLSTHTNIRKRFQIYSLNDKIRDLKIQFNEEVRALHEVTIH